MINPFLFNGPTLCYLNEVNLEGQFGIKTSFLYRYKMKAWILEKQAKIEGKPLRLTEVPLQRFDQICANLYESTFGPKRGG